MEIGKAFGIFTMFVAHKGNTELGPLYTPSEQVLETSDIVTLHSLLTPETQNMIAMLEFRMKRKPLIINTSRGGLVNEAELERALEEGLLQPDQIDVTLHEPPPGRRSTDADGNTLERDRDAACAWVSDEAQQTLPDQLIEVSRIRGGNADQSRPGRPLR